MGKINYKALQYYLHKYHIPSYYAAYEKLEEWIAINIFKEDKSRVFAASPEYAFRRRFELVDPSISYEEVKASSLQFPFASYNIFNTGFKRDERVAANPASLVYSGIEVGTTKLRASAVTLTVPTIFYFDREDDARLAYERLLFYSFNKHFYQQDVPYGDYNTIALPFNIEVKNIIYNPKYTEKDWLTQNRIFTITVDFNISTYIIFSSTDPRDPNNEIPAYNIGVNEQNHLINLTDGQEILDQDSKPIIYSDTYVHNLLVKDVICNFYTDLQKKIKTVFSFEDIPEESTSDLDNKDTIFVLEQETGDNKFSFSYYYEHRGNPINPTTLTSFNCYGNSENHQIFLNNLYIEELPTDPNTEELQLKLNWDAHLTENNDTLEHIRVECGSFIEEISSPEKKGSSVLSSSFKKETLYNFKVFFKSAGVEEEKEYNIEFRTSAGRSTKPSKSSLIGTTW